MAGLPKKYAKMGFRKGWRAYKATKSKTKIRSVSMMARRRRKGGFRRSMKRYSRKAKGMLSFGNISKLVIGVGIAALYEVFVSPMIPLEPMIKNIVELAAGLLLASMSSMPMPVRAFGAALATINLYTLLVPLISGMGSSNGSSTDW